MTNTIKVDINNHFYFPQFASDQRRDRFLEEMLPHTTSAGFSILL